MAASPVERLLEAIDSRDVDQVVALFASDARMLVADGRRAQGVDGVRRTIAEFLAEVRSVEHRITAQWNPDDVWIAEVSATYELRDWMLLRDLPRLFVAQEGDAGIEDLRVYGAHERPLSEHGGDTGLMRIGGRLIPPL